MRRREWAVTLGVGVAAVYALFRVATRYWDFGTAAGELPAAIRDYRAEGLPWAAADIASNVSAADNAAPLFRRAVAALPEEKVCDAFGKSLLEGGTEKLLPRFDPALRLAHLAAERPRLDFARDWDLGPNLLLPEGARFKLFAKLLVARAEGRAVRGDDAGALADLEDARRLAALIGNEPVLISALVSVACDRIATAGAGRCLVTAAGDAGRLARYRRWLAAPASLPDLNRAFRGEVYLILVAARNLDRFGMGRGLLPAADFEVFAGEPEEGVVDPFPVMRHEGLPTNTRSKAYMARCLQMFTELSRATHRLTDDMEAVGRHADAILTRHSESKGLSYRGSDVLFPVFSQFGRSNRVAGASRAIVLAFADALLQHAETGRWPTSTSVRDPLGTAKLRIRFDGKRFRVWSVGRNGVNDGGLSRQEAYDAGKTSDDEIAAYPPIPVRASPKPPLSPPGFPGAD